MTLRSQLSRLLLPPLIALAVLVAIILYTTLTWNVGHATHTRNAIIGVVVLSLAIVSLFIVSVVRFVGDRLSEPFDKLRRAALTNAAGGYTADVPAIGPSELVDIANAFNTMRAGLQDNISSIRESSILRELMYGEYECSLLMQHYMLDKVIEDFSSTSCEVRGVCVRTASVPRGLWLHLNESHGVISLELREAVDAGFSGIIDLLASSKMPSARVEIDLLKWRMVFHDQGLPAPLVYSTTQQRFITLQENSCSVESGDCLFLCNQALSDILHDRGEVQSWFTRVLSHFSEDGLEGIAAMLTSELEYLGKTLHLNRDLYLVCCRLS